MQSARIKSIIVDDETDAIEALEILLADLPKIELIGRFDSVDKAIDFIITHQPQLVFLDIDMPGKNGFELIEELKDLHLNPTIIFTTAHPQHAIEAIEEAAFGYLLKPIDPDKLRKVVNRYICDNYTKGKQADNKKFRFNTRSGFILINPSEILYCKAEGNYTKIVLVHKKSYLISQQIGSVYDLFDKNYLHRLGRSVIINLTYLRSIDRKKQICTLEFGGNEVILQISKFNFSDIENKI